MAAVGIRGAGASPPLITGIGGCIETDVAIAFAGIIAGFSQSPDPARAASSRARRRADEADLRAGRRRWRPSQLRISWIGHKKTTSWQSARPKSPAAARISLMPTGPKWTSRKIATSAPT